MIGKGSVVESDSGSGDRSESGSGIESASGSGVESASGSGIESASGSTSGSMDGMLHVASYKIWKWWHRNYCIMCTGPDIPDFFYPFGEDIADTRLLPVDDGSSEEILLNVPVVFYGRSEYRSYVRKNL